VTVSVLQALARVVCQVTDGGGVLAVVIRGAAWFALLILAVVAGVICVRGRDVAQPEVVLAVRVDGAAVLAVRVVDALEVGGAVRPGTLVDTLVIGAALGPRVHVVTNLGAVDVAGPAAHRAHWVLEGDIE